MLAANPPTRHSCKRALGMWTEEHKKLLPRQIMSMYFPVVSLASTLWTCCNFSPSFRFSSTRCCTRLWKETDTQDHAFIMTIWLMELVISTVLYATRAKKSSSLQNMPFHFYLEHLFLSGPVWHHPKGRSFLHGLSRRSSSLSVSATALDALSPRQVRQFSLIPKETLCSPVEFSAVPPAPGRYSWRIQQQAGLGNISSWYAWIPSKSAPPCCS